MGGEQSSARGQILCVLDRSPIPADSGGKERSLHLLRAPGTIAPLCLLVLADLDDESRHRLAQEFDGAEVRCASVRGRVRLAVAVGSWLRHWAVPFAHCRRDTSAARRLLGTLGSDRFAMTWYSSPLAWATLSDITPSPKVVNLDDVPSLVHRRIMARRAHRLVTRVRDLGRAGGARSHWLADLRALVIDLVDTGRWRRFERSLVSRADLIVVTSDDEARLLANRSVKVVPNGADDVVDPVPPAPVSATGSPTFTFPGAFKYEPNRDGAVFLAEAVAPRLRQLVPGARLVLAGSGSNLLEPVVAPHGLEVTGYLDDVREAYEEADVIVVPLRVGGGTRLKILSAWAHGRPVVSTTLGAEGLGAVDGEHLLLADTPDAFAAACARLADDVDLRRSIAASGRELFKRRYRWSSVEAAFAATLIESCFAVRAA